MPIATIDLVQKYVGGGKADPPLSKIGTSSWEKRKRRVAEAVVDLAQDLLQIQAARASAPGIAYPEEDGHWMLEFEAAFPYQETPDQHASIEAIKADMARTRPMDRLICGDVGYGKTEVAMRAAFKAVEAGKQVAVLVPTTVLAAAAPPDLLSEGWPSSPSGSRSSTASAPGGRSAASSRTPPKGGSIS